MNFELQLPTHIVCGVGSIKKLPELCLPFGKKFLLISSPELEQAVEKVKASLEGTKITFETFLLESPEPTCFFIDETAKKFKSKKFEGVIGLGGGSCLDFAKSLAISLTQKEPIWSYANLSERPPLPLKQPVLPVIAIPTTSGTGSEVTPYAVLDNPEASRKGTIQEKAIFPKVALLDPELTATMPLGLTAATACDALAHSIESFINVSKVSPVTEWAGQEAIQLLFENLPEVMKKTDDLMLRTKLAWASTLAGVAIAHRGTTTTHALAETLGALVHLPHAQCVAICTLPVLQQTWKKEPAQLAALNKILDPSSNAPDEVEAEAFVCKVEQLLNSVEMNKRVADYVTENKLEGLSEKLRKGVLAHKFRPLKQHPVEFSEEELSEIIERVLYGEK